MSTLVDERVVEMSFDNSNFEKNTKQTMNTLEEFRKTLDFSGTTKALNNSIEKVNMDPITYGLENVKQSFSAWEVVAISVISNITNRVTNLGIRMVESLSVDNIASGWMKYGENVKSVGTLLSQDGNTINTVNEALQKLMWFTDQTSYSYTDMVSNISKFTATGQGLEDSVQAMMGIANWAALSGQNAATASRAMYQLSQAMGQGTVRLMDYKSIQNANMDTKEFRENAIKTAVELGYLVERIDGVYTTTEKAAEAGKEFNVSQFTTQLSSGWFTSEVLMKTLSAYSSAVDRLYDDVNDETKGFNSAAQAIEAYEEELKTAGTEQDKFGLKAFKAAQEARTFEDAINATKDAVSSGWLATFDKVFGDYEESKRLWTDLADELWEVFAAGGEARNNIIEAWKNFGGRDDIFNQETGAFWNLWYAIKNVVDTIKYSWNTVFGFGKKFEDDTEYIDKSANSLKSFTKTLSDITGKLKTFTENNINNFSKAFRGVFSILRAITKTIKALWTGFKPLVNLLTSGSGAILDILGNIGDKFANMVETSSIFTKIADTLVTYNTKIANTLKELNIITRIKNVFDSFIQTLKDLNNRYSITSKIVNGFVSVVQLLLGAIKAITQIFIKDVWPIILKISGFLFSLFKKVGSLLIRFVSNVAEVISEFVNFLKTNERFQNGLNKLTNTLKQIPSIFVAFIPLLKSIGNIIFRLLELIVELPKALASFIKKITGSSIGQIFTTLGETITGAVTSITNAIFGFKKIDTSGIDEFEKSVEPKISPLQSMFEGLKALFDGIYHVIKAVMPVVGAIFQLIGEGLKWIAQRITSVFSGNENPLEVVKKIFSIAFWAGTITFMYNLLALFRSFTESFRLIFEGFGTLMDSKAMMQYAEALKTFAIAVLIMVASLVLLASMNVEELAKSLTVLSTLIGIMLVVMKIFNSAFTSEITGFRDGIKGFVSIFKQATIMKSVATLMLGFAASIAILAVSMKILSKLSYDQMKIALLSIITLVTLMTVVSVIIGRQRRAMALGATGLVLFAAAIRMLVKPVKILGKMKAEDLKKGLAALGAIILIVAAASRIFKFTNSISLAAFAADLIAMSLAFTLMSGMLLSLSIIKPGRIWNSVAVVFAMLAIFTAVAKVAKLSDSISLGSFAVSMTLLGLSLSIFTGSIAILAALPVAKVWNGVGSLTAFIAIMVLIAKLTGIFSSVKLIIFATGMIELGKAMAIFAGVIVLLGSMQEDALTRGRNTVQLFTLAMIGIVKLVGIFSSLKLNVFATGMILLGAAMMEFAVVVSILGSMDSGSLWKGIGAISAFIAVITLLGKFSSMGSSTGLVVLGSALVIISIGMLALSSSLAIFGAMNWMNLLKGFGVLVGTLAVLVVVSKLLGPGVIVLLALGTALTMLATAALTFASALALITTLGAGAGLAIATLLESLFNSIINLGPSLAKALDTLISALLDALSNSLTKILGMVDSLLGNIINIVGDKGPALIETVMGLITKLLEELAKNMPSIAKSLTTILIALLDALKESAGRIIQDVLDILFALIDKVTENVPIFMEKIGNLVITLIESAVKTIVDMTPRLIGAAFDLILGLIDGLGQAIEDNAVKVRDTMINFCKHLWNAFLKFFGINSPSTKAEDGGNNIILGLIKGIVKGISSVVRAIGDLCKNMWNTVKGWLKTFADWGKNIIKGIWNGIKSVWNGFVNFWKNIWKGITDWFCNLFGIHSPSRLFYGYGQNTVQGYQDGIDDGKDGVYDAMEEVKDEASATWDDDDIYAKYGEQINQAISDALILNSGIIYNTFNQMITDCLVILEDSKDEFSSIIKTIIDYVNSNITDDELTIRPVMDLSEIQNGTALIAGMLSSVGGYSISSANKLAEQTSSDMSKLNSNKITPATTNGENNLVGNNGENYNVIFNIYNSDPQAVADEVNKRLQVFIDRRNKQWA